MFMWHVLVEMFVLLHGAPIFLDANWEFILGLIAAGTEIRQRLDIGHRSFLNIIR